MFCILFPSAALQNVLICAAVDTLCLPLHLTPCQAASKPSHPPPRMIFFICYRMTVLLNAIPVCIGEVHLQTVWQRNTVCIILYHICIIFVLTKIFSIKSKCKLCAKLIKFNTQKHIEACVHCRLENQAIYCTVVSAAAQLHWSCEEQNVPSRMGKMERWRLKNSHKNKFGNIFALLKRDVKIPSAFGVISL